MSTTAEELAKLSALIEDQTTLIEQLYKENTDAIKSIEMLSTNNKHLSAANDKQKSRIIHLNRKMKLQSPTAQKLFKQPADDSSATLATALNPI